MHPHKHEAAQSAKSKMARMSVSHGTGTSSNGGAGVEEDYGNKAAGPSSAAHFKRGGAVEGEKAKMRLDKPERGHFKRGGAVKHGKKGTTVNIVVGHPGGANAPAAIPMPPPVGGPPPGGMPPAMIPPQRPPMPMPMPMGGAPGGMNTSAPGLPMRKKGGRVEMTAGAMSGEGRLEKAEALRRKNMKPDP